VREKETRRGTRGAGNPERRAAHQGQQQQKRKQMQADDAKGGGKSQINGASSKSGVKESNLIHDPLASKNETGSVLNDLQTKRKSNESVTVMSSSLAPPRQEYNNGNEDGTEPRINSEDLLELQERITKEILNSKLKENDMIELQVRSGKDSERREVPLYIHCKGAVFG